MKSLGLLVFLIGCLAAAGQGIVLNAGDVFSFTFTSLNPGSTPPVPRLSEAAFEATLSGDGLSIGESLRLEMFEDTLLQPPFASDTVTGTVFSFPSVFVTAPNSPTAHWSDLQGCGRITMLTGSVRISALTFSTQIGTRFLSSTFPVPEPSVTRFLLPTITVILSRTLWRRAGQSRRDPKPGSS